MDKIDSSDVLDKLRLEAGKYILASTHWEENVDNKANFLSLMTTINYIAEHCKMTVICYVQPIPEAESLLRSVILHSILLCRVYCLLGF